MVPESQSHLIDVPFKHVALRFCRLHGPQSVFHPVRLWLYAFSLGTPSGMVTSYSSGGGFPSSLGTYVSIYFICPFCFLTLLVCALPSEGQGVFQCCQNWQGFHVETTPTICPDLTCRIHKQCLYLSKHKSEAATISPSILHYGPDVIDWHAH